MLRKFINAHLAFSGSPEKEQRLLAFARDEKKRPGESPESEKKQSEETGVEGNVGSMRSVIRQHSLVTAPEAIANIPRKDTVFDLVLTSGSTELQEQLEKIARAEQIDIEKAKKEEKEALINTLFQSPLHAAQSARIIEARLLRDEELTNIVEKKLKSLSSLSEGNKTIDVAILEPLVERLRGSSQGTRSEITESIINELGLSKILHAEADQSHAADILMQMYDALKAEHKRSAMVDTEQEIGDDRSSLQTARGEYKELLSSQLDGTKEYLEASIQNAAEFLYREFAKEHDKYTEATNEEMMKTCGVTVNGFLEAFQASTIFAHVASRSDDRPNARNLPNPKDGEYLMDAERVIRGMAHAEKSLERTNDGNFPDQPLWLREKRLEEEKQERTAAEIGTTVRRLTKKHEESSDPASKAALEFLSPQEEIFGAFADDTAPLDDRVEMRRMPPQAIRKVETTLSILETQPTIFQKMHELETLQKEGVENIPLTRARLEKELQTAESELMKYMYQPVCQTINAAEMVRERAKRIRYVIRAQENTNNQSESEKVLATAQYDIRQLEEAKRLLDILFLNESNTHYLEQDEYEKTGAHPETKGFYEDRTGIVTINVSRAPTEGDQQRVLEHERGHGILNILARKAFIAPALFAGVHQRLQYHAKEKNVDFDTLLQSKGERWHCTRNGEVHIEDVLDELIVRYTDWKQGRMTKPDAESLKLFKLMESNTHGEADGSMPSLDLKQRRYLDDEEEGEENPITNENQRENVRDYKLELDALKSAHGRIDGFFDSYPQHLQEAGISEFLEMIKSGYKGLQKAFNDGTDPTLPEYQALYERVEEDTKKMSDEIARLDQLYMDLTYSDPSQIFSFRKLFDRVHWVTVGDVWVMFKEAGEDVQRMWKRRGEGARAKFGKTLFGHIPKGIPFFGQLAREFEGRYQSSEQEEVSVWEKRYETVDSHSLLHKILPESRNKDELKAITNLLTKRGRMDWNFEKYWTVLESLSDYHMPHKPCMRDIGLRDMYLQKLIANIWTDTDLFEQWKNENDSAIGSGKSKFQATIDTLSGTPGGLGKRLEHLLQKHIDRKSGKPVSEEEEINPHLYEGILHYAMKNGKATLEEKIFYTIQGVAHGILNIDRVKGLHGEQGGIINIFTFIDFFNGKSTEDIMAMARKLGKDDTGGPLVKPDYRTTDFILNDIANDEGAQQRTKKGLKNAQDMDHEDFPGMTPMLDWVDIDGLVGFWSGERVKITPEGMKNMYVGYNSLLQSYAIRAKKANVENRPMAFSVADAKKLASILGAFKHFDNLTTHAAEDKRRPRLSWSSINNDVPVTGGNRPEYKTKDYRNNLNGFISRLVGTVGITSASGKKKEGADELTASMEDYIGVDRNDEIKSEAIYVATGDFVNQLTQKLVENKDELVDLLAGMVNDSPENGGFIAERADYTYQNVMEAEAAQRTRNAQQAA